MKFYKNYHYRNYLVCTVFFVAYKINLSYQQDINKMLTLFYEQDNHNVHHNHC
jgi:hypothetical protein